MTRNRFVCFAAGLFTMFVAEASMFRNAQNQPVFGSLLFIILGLGIVLFSAGRFITSSIRDFRVSETPDTFRIRGRWLVLAFGLIFFTTWRSVQQPQQALLAEYMLSWVCAMLALLRAFGATIPAFQRREAFIVIGLFIVAFIIRVLDLNGTPHLMDQDEGLFALSGAAIRQAGFLINPFAPGVQSHPNLYQSWIALSIQIFGQTIGAARLPSALLGALGVPAVYLLGRELYGQRVGIGAALFTLSWPLHILFSRISLNQPADPFFGTLCFYFFLRGLRGKSGNAVNFAASGLCLGIAQLFYLGGRLLPIILLAYVIFLWLSERRTLTIRWRQVLIVPFAAFVVVLPQNAYLLRFSQPLTTRNWTNFLLSGSADVQTASGASLWQGWPAQLYNSFFALWTVPDHSWYGESSNLMGLLGGPLVLLGVAISLLTLRRYPLGILPLGWALAVIVGGSTLGLFPPQYQRYFPGVSAFALLVALGIVGIADVFMLKFAEHTNKDELVLALSTLICVGNLAFFALVFIPEKRYFANRPNEVTNQLALTMRAAADDHQQVLLFSNPYPHTNAAIEKVSVSSEVYYSNGVEDTTVVKYLMAGRPFTVIYDPFSIAQVENTINFHHPFVIIVPLIYRDSFDTLWKVEHPGGEPLLIGIHEDNNPAFLMYKSVTGLP